MNKNLYLLIVCLLISTATTAQSSDSSNLKEDPPLSVTQHNVRVGGQTINYTTTTGYLVLRKENGDARAKMFFIAYTQNGVEDVSKRPITYTFNGGPGSSSVWLHMGGLGPRRIKMSEKGESLPPPYELVDNEYTWLDKTDLVFIDPVETGFSRPAEGVEKSEFTGFEEDISSVGDFIRLYTTRNSRWSSPKFLAGESYGTTRAAGLSGYLQDRHGMYLNGLMLISSILNFQTARFTKGNDLPYILFLPTYAAIAWYHDQLPNRPDALEPFLREVEEFAMGDYASALMLGDQLPEDQKNQIINKLHQYTGLSKEYLERIHYRIHISRFVKELRRDEGITVGRLDGRMTGVDYDDAGEFYEFDPSYSATIYGPYTTAINSYLKAELDYENDLPYEILTGRVRPWSYSNVENEFLNVAETLRSAMSKNPFLKIHVFNGYYDLATPYFATDYTFNHMFLDEKLTNNVSMSFYESSHMMYIHQPSLVKMKQQVDQFIEQTLPN
ncbi:S10 family peptidase [Tunicatimonas pelagia]|uniref:S10 family peptidase n=1 Tax=Tunicatimonas pelagia TaxID=931531 RepID=UPI002666F106|nr:peptidase S10 [Tunicatimonas pelagia]WKN41659.1 peptidase S10 [Tunicatimonas pelagia]